MISSGSAVMSDPPEPKPGADQCATTDQGHPEIEVLLQEFVARQGQSRNDNANHGPPRSFPDSSEHIKERDEEGRKCSQLRAVSWLHDRVGEQHERYRGPDGG